MKNIKRFAFVGAMVLVIALALVVMVVSPRLETAKAMEIMENDPQVSAVIEKYDLQVKEVDVQDNIAYIVLDCDDLKVTITVDLEVGTVGKIVTKNGETTHYTEDIEKANVEFEAKAKANNMTVEEYKAYLENKKK